MEEPRVARDKEVQDHAMGRPPPPQSLVRNADPNSVLTDELGRSNTTSFVAACNLHLIDDWLFDHNIKSSRSWLDCEEV